MTSPKTSGDSAPARYARTFRMALLFMVLAFVTSILPLPYTLLAGVFALVAIAGYALAALRSRGSGRARFALIPLLLGIPASALLLVQAAFTGLFYGPVSTFQECMDLALTNTAQQECARALPDHVVEWITGRSR